MSTRPRPTPTKALVNKGGTPLSLLGFKDLPLLLGFDDLRALGIDYSRVHIWRMGQRGTFPLPLQIGPNRIAWPKTDITEWLASRPRARAKRRVAA